MPINLTKIKQIFFQPKIIIPTAMVVFAIFLIFSLTQGPKDRKAPEPTPIATKTPVITQIPKVLSVQPLDKQKKVPLDTKIVVQLENPPENQIQLQINPNVELDLTKPAETEFVFTPKEKLALETNYQLRLLIGSQQFFSWRFSTVSVLDQLVTKLPFETQDFAIRAVAENDSYKFYIRHKTLPPEKVEEKVKAWFQSQGVSDISKLEIFWSPVPGSLKKKLSN